MNRCEYDRVRCGTLRRVLLYLFEWIKRMVCVCGRKTNSMQFYSLSLSSFSSGKKTGRKRKKENEGGREREMKSTYKKSRNGEVSRLRSTLHTTIFDMIIIERGFEQTGIVGKSSAKGHHTDRGGCGSVRGVWPRIGSGRTQDTSDERQCLTPHFGLNERLISQEKK